MIPINTIRKYWQKKGAIERFLSEPLSLDLCKNIIRRDYEDRNERFLSVVRSVIFEKKIGPYNLLCKWASIAYDDIKKSVEKNGIEATLAFLKEEGVYVTFEEFKGFCPIIRKNHSVTIQREDFYSICDDSLGYVYSGSSRGRGTRIHWSVAYIMQRAVHEAIMFDMYKCFDVPLLAWYPFFPSHLALYPLRLRKLRIKTTWFSPVPINGATFLDRLFYKYVILGNIPFNYVPFSDVKTVIKWIQKQRAACGRCCVSTFASAAVRVCLAVKEEEFDIRGTIFIVTGEPLTQCMRETIESIGCQVVNAYYFSEGGFFGCSCGDINMVSRDIHLFQDSFAVINHERISSSIQEPVSALLTTALYDGCPIGMINLENGDMAQMHYRHCATMQEKGYKSLHLSNIRSFEKCTANGLTYYISELIDALEQHVVPTCGGSILDYQLVEEQMNGLPQLVLYVHPHLSINEEGSIKKALLKGIAYGHKNDMRTLIMEQIEALVIKRAEPLVTIRGKTLPFYSRINIKHTK